ncbi:Uncharacterised protein [Streptococcus equi subsp. zooepidemicus]|uniref:Bacteriocin n=1 Tax=Streptococcus equi subsp. zooepidemicus TaxID=40041 RepID=A0AAX2LIH7_STRSZ|nr:hypothetical protein [Streptococcus equi]WOK57907.1 hypothetical protein RIM63_03810 [Streptococcus equi subsp. zooepidemicus]SQE95666.1 Uncharacterised protein [Streptococcus equi subsp. zooepidemicus]SUO82577.1 Uncharacterised protein [Streptococcus equi subsp. zooepidemicus]HEL1075142.1 hypothetical protein [Streptococcus equi subsp. zooepidemicus]HEL1351161.1 hypothetical protein [Streptococcus equi subsp. zooepidemicus]
MKVTKVLCVAGAVAVLALAPINPTNPTQPQTVFAAMQTEEYCHNGWCSFLDEHGEWNTKREGESNSPLQRGSWWDWISYWSGYIWYSVYNWFR